MSASLRRYIAIETAIAVLANIAMSDAAAAIVLHGHDRIPIAGPRGLAVDMAIQSFAVAFMSVLIATVLTRRRCRAGVVGGLTGNRPRGPHHAGLRAALVAFGCAAIATPLAVLLLGVGPPVWTLPATIVLKTLYAALLAILVSPPALRAALRDPPE